LETNRQLHEDCDNSASSSNPSSRPINNMDAGSDPSPSSNMNQSLSLSSQTHSISDPPLLSLSADQALLRTKVSVPDSPQNGPSSDPPVPNLLQNGSLSNPPIRPKQPFIMKALQLWVPGKFNSSDNSDSGSNSGSANGSMNSLTGLVPTFNGNGSFSSRRHTDGNRSSYSPIVSARQGNNGFNPNGNSSNSSINSSISNTGTHNNMSNAISPKNSSNNMSNNGGYTGNLNDEILLNMSRSSDIRSNLSYSDHEPTLEGDIFIYFSYFLFFSFFLFSVFVCLIICLFINLFACSFVCFSLFIIFFFYSHIDRIICGL
jgi:hypothetical protein